MLYIAHYQNNKARTAIEITLGRCQIATDS